MAKKAPVKVPSGKEKVGYHKGSLTTLAREREALMEMLKIVEQLMQMHIKELKDLGVDLEKAAQTQAKSPSKASASKEPIEDLLK